jgi:hypothetical protein
MSGIVSSGLTHVAHHASWGILRKQIALGRRPSIGILNARLEGELND